jgi:hypothetical protein
MHGEWVSVDRALFWRSPPVPQFLLFGCIIARSYFLAPQLDSSHLCLRGVAVIAVSLPKHPCGSVVIAGWPYSQHLFLWLLGTLVRARLQFIQDTNLPTQPQTAKSCCTLHIPPLSLLAVRTISGLRYHFLFLHLSSYLLIPDTGHFACRPWSWRRSAHIRPRKFK